MSYLPELRDSLVEAAYRKREAAEHTGHRTVQASPPGRRSRHWRAVFVSLLLCLGGTAVALAATGVFRRGTTVGPPVAPSPRAGTGVAIASSVELLGLRVPNPGGGPPWGLRVVKTTRGLTCLQLGRVEFGTIGVLGQDGAFHDDRRFHPISPNVGGSCGVSDAHGNGFITVSQQSAPASAIVGYELPTESCVSTLERYPPGFPRRSRLRHLHPPGFRAHNLPVCPTGDLHNMYFGLLGPEALSITYPGPGGKLITTPTSGPDGAYLLIRPPTTISCQLIGPKHGAVCGNGDSSSPELPAGVITAVHYRDGHVCRLPAPEPAGTLSVSCPPFGYIAPATRKLTTAQLATPITVEKIPVKAYCSKLELIVPCEGTVPRGFKRLTRGPRSLLVQISFRSRIAIPDSRSYYRYLISNPRSRDCTDYGSGGPTNADIRAGQLVLISTFVPYSCPGIVRGIVSYVPTEGPAGAMDVEGLPGQGTPIPVGRFSFRVP